MNETPRIEVLLDRDGVEVWRHEGAPPEEVLRAQVALVVHNAQRPRPPAPGGS